MRLKYAIKFWFYTFLVGFVGVLLFGLLIHNPNSVEISGSWYQSLSDFAFGMLPYIFFISIFFSPLALLIYNPHSSENDIEKAVIMNSLFKKRSMLPAYATSLITVIVICGFSLQIDKSGMGALIAIVIVMLFLAILIPINIFVWIMCLKQSR